MSSEGPEMVGGRYGAALSGRKIEKSGDKPEQPLSCSPVRFRRVRRRFSRPASSGGGAPPCPARVAVWWPVVPPLVQTPTACKWSNGLTWCSRFWRVFS